MGCHNRHNHARSAAYFLEREDARLFLLPYMPFSERAKATALAIVKIFETAKPFGNYSAVAVLADGAGISYGTSQFTHRSGSLAAVITRYAKLSGAKGINERIAAALNDFRTGRNIEGRSADKALKAALAEAGKDPLMQQAQREIAFENYLRPALNACEGSDFIYPLSLAVVYDSINQGGYDTVRDRTKFDPPGNGSIKPEEFEKEWISEYCRQRKKWLSASRKPIVRATTYRPNFFLGEIARGNWELKLPMTVHGHKLTEAIMFPKASTAAISKPQSEPSDPTPTDRNDTSKQPAVEQPQPPEQPPAPPEKVAVEKEPEPEEGFLKRKWKQITGAITGIGGMQTLKENADSVSFLGLTAEVMQWIVGIAVLLFLIWLIGSLFLEKVWLPLKSRWLTTSLVQANSTPTNIVEVVSCDRLAEMEKQGYTVVRRS